MGWQLLVNINRKKENSILIHDGLITSLKSAGITPGRRGGEQASVKMKVGILDALNK